jgi:hypothetical protein
MKISNYNNKNNYINNNSSNKDLPTRQTNSKIKPIPTLLLIKLRIIWKKFIKLSEISQNNSKIKTNYNILNTPTLKIISLI